MGSQLEFFKIFFLCVLVYCLHVYEGTLVMQWLESKRKKKKRKAWTGTRASLSCLPWSSTDDKQWGLSLYVYLEYLGLTKKHKKMLKTVLERQADKVFPDEAGDNGKNKNQIQSYAEVQPGERQNYFSLRFSFLVIR